LSNVNVAVDGCVAVSVGDCLPSCKLNDNTSVDGSVVHVGDAVNGPPSVANSTRKVGTVTP
jgi:hypothetical protein